MSELLDRGVNDLPQEHDQPDPSTLDLAEELRNLIFPRHDSIDFTTINVTRFRDDTWWSLAPGVPDIWHGPNGELLYADDDDPITTIYNDCE